MDGTSFLNDNLKSDLEALGIDALIAGDDYWHS